MNTANLNSPYLPSFFLKDNEVPPGCIADPPAAESIRLARQQPKRIFVIDDEAAIADSLTEILKDAGYDATAFHGGHAAIESARRLS
jgi:hypothetical protein